VRPNRANRGHRFGLGSRRASTLHVGLYQLAEPNARRRFPTERPERIPRLVVHRNTSDPGANANWTRRPPKRRRQNRLSSRTTDDLLWRRDNTECLDGLGGSTLALRSTLATHVHQKGAFLDELDTSDIRASRHDERGAYCARMLAWPLPISRDLLS
jgi:hypothetical protein